MRESLDLQVDLSIRHQRLSDALTEITPWFQSNVESITDPVKAQDFLMAYAKKENELLQLVVKELARLKGTTEGASMLWLPQKSSGI